MTAFSPCQGHLLLVLNCLVFRVTRSLSGSRYIYAHKLKYIYLYNKALRSYIHICLYICVSYSWPNGCTEFFFQNSILKNSTGNAGHFSQYIYNCAFFLVTFSVFSCSFSKRYFFKVLSSKQRFLEIILFKLMRFRINVGNCLQQ